MKQLTTIREFEALRKPCIVWFSATWCGPCKRMHKPLIEETAAAAGVPLYYCENEEISDLNMIKMFPTFIAFNGDTQERYSSADTVRACQFIKRASAKLAPHS